MVVEIIKITLTVVSLIFTGIQILFLAQNVKENREWNARDAAFKYCIEYNKLINEIDFNFKNELNITNNTKLKIESFSYDKFFDSQTPEGIKNCEEANKLLRYYERLSVGILCGYFDEEVVRRIMNRTLKITYENLRPYILKRRGETESKISTHFERVAETWIDTPLNYPRRDTPSKRKQ